MESYSQSYSQMNATASIAVDCPTCRTNLALPGFGRFTCPKCGQSIEVAEEALRAPPVYDPRLNPKPPKIKKLEVNNGFGWWTPVYFIAWTFMIPGAVAAFFGGLCVVMAFTDAKGEASVFAFGTGALFVFTGLIFWAIGLGLANWSRGSKLTLICANCRNPTTRHAKLCTSCQSTFE